MTEEINYSYDGGLYAELVRNRTFKWNPSNAVYWQLVQDGGGAGSMSLDTNQPLNSALTRLRGFDLGVKNISDASA